MSLRKNIIAFFVIGALGTLGHFLYEWSGENSIVGLFFPVNESTWEHLKLLFFPTALYSVFEYLFSKKRSENYIPAITISVICGMLTIVTLFYTVRGIIGYNIDLINITIYFISIIVMLCKKTKIIKNVKFSSNTAFWIFLVIAAAIAIMFIVWSYKPPSIGIFTPPVEN